MPADTLIHTVTLSKVNILFKGRGVLLAYSYSALYLQGSVHVSTQYMFDGRMNE